MGSGSGSEQVRTTKLSIYISKNHKNIEQGRKLIENNRRGSTRSGELCLSYGGDMALTVSTLQYLESSKGFWQESIAAGSCCDAAAGKCALRWHSRSLNGEVVFCNFRHNGILNGMALSKLRLINRRELRSCSSLTPHQATSRAQLSKFVLDMFNQRRDKRWDEKSHRTVGPPVYAMRPKMPAWTP